MSNKKAYIDYKNNTLLEIINTNKQKLHDSDDNKKMVETRAPMSNHPYIIEI